MLIKIINKECIIGKEFYLRQTEDKSLEDNLSDNSEELLQRSIFFSTVLYLVRTKNIKQETSQRYIPSRFLKKERSTYIQKVSRVLAPENGILALRRTSICILVRNTFIPFAFMVCRSSPARDQTHCCHHSSDPSHGTDNARSLTRCATGEPPIFIFNMDIL